MPVSQRPLLFVRGALILQLNFSNQHDRAFKRFLNCDEEDFQYDCHPTSNRRNTLGWARIDVDFNTDEALIEEIQSDWLRRAISLQQRAERMVKAKREEILFYGQVIAITQVLNYLKALEQHYQLWQEALLNAAINFVFDELGIRSLYYHTYSTGTKLKRMSNCPPPKSLYTELPKRFCFATTTEAPRFLLQDKKSKRVLKALKETRWHHHETERLPC